MTKALKKKIKKKDTMSDYLNSVSKHSSLMPSRKSIKLRAFNDLLDYCKQKYDLFDRDDPRLIDLFDKHFEDRVRIHRDDYYWLPSLQDDYWLHMEPSGMPLSLNESEVLRFWEDIETIWHDHLCTALRGHNDVPKCLPIYQLHFASERHPVTCLRVTVWRSMYQSTRNVTYLIMNESATTVLHRLRHVRQLDQSQQILLSELRLRTGSEIYWLLDPKQCISSTVLDAHYRADTLISADLSSFVILSSLITRPRRRPFYLDGSKLHVRPEPIDIKPNADSTSK